MTAPIDTSILPDHVLSAILTVAKRRKVPAGRFAFRGHDYALQRVFNELRRECNSALLDAFVFSDTGPVPYSPILNDSVSKLQLSGLIGHENPDYEVLFLSRSAEAFYNTFVSLHLPPSHTTQLSHTSPPLSSISPPHPT